MRNPSKTSEKQACFCTHHTLVVSVLHPHFYDPGIQYEPQVDIDAGLLAESQASQANVKDFAWLMVLDYSGLNTQATDLVTALPVTPQDNPTSQSLKTGGEQNVAHLKTLHGTAFDNAYIAHEVTYHERVLKALDTTLIPNAQNAALKALLVEVRPVVVRHLAHAKRVQATLAE